MTIKDFYDELKMIHAENYELEIDGRFVRQNVEEIDYKVEDNKKIVRIYSK